MTTIPTSPDCYWVEPGLLLAGEYPGHPLADTARVKVRALINAGVRVFLDLTERGEYGLEPYEPFVDEAHREGREVRYCRLAIRDVSVPPPAHMRQILRVIDEAVANGETMYVHCWGGVGRTGTVVGCWLIERHRAGDDPIAAIRALRHACRKAGRCSPETDEQRDFVRAWPRHAGHPASAT